MLKGLKNKRLYIALGLIWFVLISALIYVGINNNITETPKYASEEELVAPDSALLAPDESISEGETSNIEAGADNSTAAENRISEVVPEDETALNNDSEINSNNNNKDTGKKSSSDTKGSSEKKPDPTKKPKQTKPPKAPKEQKYYSFTIECKKVADRPELWRDGLEEFIPADGIFYSGRLKYEKNLSVYDALKNICDNNNILMDSRYTPIYETYYVAGIGNLYEFDCGAESGWKYSVNGITPGIGSSRYTIEAGDEVVFFYDISI